MNRSFAYSLEVEQEQQRFITKVYGWMFMALTLTGITAMKVAASTSFMQLIFGNRLLFFGLIIVELALVGTLVGMISKLSANTAILIFTGYSILNGVTLSMIFFIYTQESISSTFFITAFTFGAMSAYGYFTKTDLTRMGNIAIMGLFGIIIASVVNIFMQSSAIYWVTTYIGILVFVGLTAYDTQKIKAMNIIGNEGTEEDKKEAILGALTLYLDFINLFLLLLRIFGRRR